MKGRERILDELLVLRSQDGDVAAFENLARRWQPRLLRLARRLTQSPEAGEVVQEAWLAIVRGLPRLADPARFGTWAFRIVAHKSTDWIRLRQKGRSLAERVEREPQPEGPPSTEEEVSRSQGVAQLRKALPQLSDGHRGVLEMFYLRAFSVQTISEKLGVSPGTVKSRLFHARKVLRAALEESP